MPCLWTQPIVSYFNDLKVKSQLNVLPELWSKNWSACEFDSIYYTESMAGSAYLYNRLRDRGYRTLFFSGTNDAIVPTQGTQQWISAQGWNVTDAWRPYFYPVGPNTKQIVGYLESRDNFTFATVHNVGHFSAGGAKRAQIQKLVYAFVRGEKIDLL